MYYYGLLEDLPTGSGSQALTPSLFSDADVFFAPTVGRGAVTLAPSLFSDADTFYGPTVTQFGDVTLTPSLYVNENTFFGATVSGGSAVKPGGGFYQFREHRHKIGNERAQKKKRDAIEHAEEVISAIDPAFATLRLGKDGLIEERLDEKIAALRAAESQAEIVAKAKMVEEFTAILKRMAEEEEDEEEALALLLA